MTTLISNIRFSPDLPPRAWILIDGDSIAAVGEGTPPAAHKVVDGQGFLALPGAIDCHVHFREPGLTEKADIASESRAAICGGVTSYLEMPNTKPATTTIDLWQQKMQLAQEKSLANYAFFIGATNDNIGQLKAADYTRVPGVKLFMGSSTGNMLVDDDATISRIFREVNAIVSVHAEDQDIIESNTELMRQARSGSDFWPAHTHSCIRSVSACFNSSKKAVGLALKYRHLLHLCHISTEAELSLLREGDPSGKLITAEVSPHHLMWTAEDYDEKGMRIKMNPAVKSPADRAALRRAVADGSIDIVATDHAPHRLADKDGDVRKAASGAPLVQFSLPWMLDHFDVETVKRVMCENPAKVYRIHRRGALLPGYYADIVLVGKRPRIVHDSDVVSKCGWTPMDGTPLTHTVYSTWVNGTEVFRDGLFALVKTAMPLRFNIL